MPNSPTDFCNGGNHYILDSNDNKYVHVGGCEEHHEEPSAPNPKQQVVQGAQSALAAALGNKKLFPFGNPVDNAKKSLGGE